MEALEGLNLLRPASKTKEGNRKPRNVCGLQNLEMVLI